ncbi:ComEC/Rec2 family competence protein [Myceligenerans crystallogenes]
MTDVRLLPGAVAAWAAAWWATGGSEPARLAAVSGWLAILVGICAIGVIGLRGGGRREHARAGLRWRGGMRGSDGRRGLGGLQGRGGQRGLGGLRGPDGLRGSGGLRGAGGLRGRPGRAAAGRGAAHQVVLAGACALAVVAGGAVQAAGSAVVRDLAEGRFTAELTGTVATQPEPFSWGGAPSPAGVPGEAAQSEASAPGQVRFLLEVGSIDARGVRTAGGGRVQVVTAGADGLRFGSVVTVRGGLRPPRTGGTETGALTAGYVTVQRSPPAALRLLDRHRDALMEVTDGLSPQARALVPGAAIGDTTRMPADLEEAMRAVGLAHITAVSGGHFSVVMAVLSALCAVARLPRAGRVALIAVASCTFLVLVRPEPAVLRAGVMAAFALTGLALGRPAASVPALAGSVIGLLVVDPWLARSFGFALSAAATAGLVLLVAPLARRLTPWIGGPAAFALAVPLAAQLACGPVLVLLDPSVPTMSVVANLLAAPAVFPATVLGLLATILAPWLPLVAGPIAWVAGGATWWIAVVAGFLASLPGASLPWPGGPPGALLLAALTGIGLWAVLRREPLAGRPQAWRPAPGSGLRGLPRRWRREPPQALLERRRPGQGVAFRGRSSRPGRAAVPGRRPRLTRGQAGTLLAAGIAVLLLVVVAAPRFAALGEPLPRDWQVAACDVGQGDSLALRTGPASAIVVDVGPEGPAADRCLGELGVTTVDLLVLSHFHADHVGGLGPVLAGRKVTAALVTPVDDPPAGAAATRASLAAAGIPAGDARAGQQGVAGTVRWEVLQAGAGNGTGDAPANDASIALVARTPDLDVLLLGDLEASGQQALVAELGSRGATRFDVVKVAHHGSAEQSPDLAALTRPAVAIFSAGRDNEYGHPTGQALDLYEGAGAAIVRTDECGTAVLVVRDGEIGSAGC